MSDTKWKSDPEGWRFGLVWRGRPIVGLSKVRMRISNQRCMNWEYSRLHVEMELPSNRCVKFYTLSLLLINHNTNPKRRQLAGTILTLEVHILFMTSRG